MSENQENDTNNTSTNNNNEDISSPSYYFKCSECYRVPRLKILSPVDLEIECDNRQCGKVERMEIREFISNVKKLQKESSKRLFCSEHKNKLKKFLCLNCISKGLKCKECKKECRANSHRIIPIEKVNTILSKCCETDHNNQDVLYYCMTCTRHLCDKCKEDKFHLKHEILTLKDYVSEKEINQMKEIVKNIDETNKKNFNLANEIKEKVTKLGFENQLKDNIELLNKYSNEYNNIHLDIIQFFNLLFEFYSNTKDEFYNYYIFANIKDNLKLNFEEFKINYKVYNENNNVDIDSENNNSTEIDNEKLTADDYEKIVNELTLKFKTKFIFDSMKTIEATFNSIFLCEINATRIQGDYNCDISFENDIIDLQVEEVETMINKHTDKINQLLFLDDNRLCSCSNDGLVNIYNEKHYNTIDIQIDNHNHKFVYSICQLKNGVLLSAGADNKIQFYHLKKKTYETDKSHIKLDGVNNVICLENNKFCASSLDGSINIYEYNNKESYKNPIYFYHPEKRIEKIKIRCIFYSFNTQLLISDDVEDLICFWDISNLTYENMRNFRPVCQNEGIECATSYGMCEIIDESLEFNLVIGGFNGISIFNLNSRTKVCPGEYDSRLMSSYSFIYINVGIFLCTSSLNKLCLLDMDCEIRNSYNNANDKSAITIIKRMSNGRFASASGSQTIKIWKYDIVGNTTQYDEEDDDFNSH